MKGKILLLYTMLIMIFCTACSSEGQVKKVTSESTNLSDVNVNDIVLGVSGSSLDLSKYTTIPIEQTAGDKNTLYFEELQITTNNDGIVTLVKGIVGDGTQVNVNNSQPTSINEVISQLGTNYNEYWFDREQNIKAYTYYDNTKKMYATFAAFDNNLIWLILNQ